ncbi:MAG: alpha/beta fold hydrolase [Solirubrobacterales bacterium]
MARAATTEGPKRLTVESSGLRLAGDRWRASGPERGTLLLLHGGGQTRHSWDRSAAELQRTGWTSVTMDLRGHGESEWDPAGDYSVDTIAVDTLATCRALGAGPDQDGRPVLVGASMGGMAALLATRLDPECCRALVLVDIALRVEPEGRDRVRAFMAQKPEGFSSLEEAAAAVADYTGRERPADLSGLAKNLRRTEEGRWRWHWDPRLLDQAHDSEDPMHPIRVRMREAATMLSVPVLLVRGLRSDVVSEESLEEARRLLPTAAVARVSEAGHMVSGDDNASFLDAIRDFLGSL